VRIFVGQPLPEPSTSELLAGHDVVVGTGSLPPAEVREHLPAAEALLPTPRERVTRDVLAAAPRLLIVASCSVGTDHIDLVACRERGLVVTNTPGVLTEATADLAWSLILAVTRRVTEGEALLRSGRWDGWKPLELLGTGLQGKTLGVYGMGRIGAAVARRAGAFGLHVIGMTDADGEDRFEEILRASDVVTIHAPLTPATRGRFGRSELLRMKRGAFLVNTARGPIVDEGALVAALEAGHLGGAGLDVYENEPAVHAGLLRRKDVTLLPHLGSATRETRLAMARLACAEIARFFRGEPLHHRVV
jgi:glyoxylate reductase